MPESKDLLETVREKVFGLPLLPQNRVIEFFAMLDGSLQDTIDELLFKTNFVETYLSDVVAEVAASVTHGRTIYGRDTTRQKERERPKPKPGSPGEVFKRSSDIKFLEQSINVLHLLSFYRERDPADVVSYKNLTKSILQEIKFVRLVYEEVIQKFIQVTDGYVELAVEATRVHNRMHAAKNKSTLTVLGAQYSDLHDEMVEIEESVHCDRRYLYHLCMMVDRNHKRQIKIRDTVHEPYLRIVYKEAKRHATNPQQVLDNFQNGSTGLLRAISCYNLDRNVSFSSYSHWWIRQAILFSIKDSSNFVKLPVTTWQTYTGVEKQRAKMATRDGSDTLEALAEETGHSVNKLKEIYSAVRSSHVHSLDYEVDETGKMMLIDVIPDEASEEKENQSEICADVDKRLQMLPPEQRWVLHLHYGMISKLKHREELTQEDIMQEKLRQRIAGVRS